MNSSGLASRAVEQMKNESWQSSEKWAETNGFLISSYHNSSHYCSSNSPSLGRTVHQRTAKKAGPTWIIYFSSETSLMETWLWLYRHQHPQLCSVCWNGERQQWYTCMHKVITSSCWSLARLRATGGGLNQEGQSGARSSGQIVFNPLASRDWSFLKFMSSIFWLKNEVK